MKLTISQNGVKREINGDFAICASIKDIERLIWELKFIVGGMRETGMSYGWSRISDQHPDTAGSQPVRTWNDVSYRP